MKESEYIEFKESWRDDYLRIISAFANTNDGQLFIGIKDNVPENVPENRLEYILLLMKGNPLISMQQLSNKLNVSIQTIKKDVQGLKDNYYVKRIGPAKGGYWEVLKDS